VILKLQQWSWYKVLLKRYCLYIDGQIDGQMETEVWKQYGTVYSSDYTARPAKSLLFYLEKMAILIVKNDVTLNISEHTGMCSLSEKWINSLAGLLSSGGFCSLVSKFQ
jgi:hypothetical protein